MSKFSSTLSIAMLFLCIIPYAALAQESNDESETEMTREERRAEWENLSDEEKQAKREELRALREQKRAEWESMSPEEREAKRAEMRERWESMTPEQRDAIKQRRMHKRNRARNRRDDGNEGE